MTGKLTSLSQAVRDNVRPGDTIFVGGFGQCVPFATVHEIVRQRIDRLTLCRTGADIAFDLLVGAGAVRKIVAGYVGNPGIGLAHAFRRAAEAGDIEVELWTNFSMALRLHAGALGIPFIPAHVLLEGDVGRDVSIMKTTCPYTGAELSAVPALRPDVAIIHAHRADAEGNIQIDGLTGDIADGALASARIVATVEQVVSPEELRRRPETTIVPAFRVSAVANVKHGAFPSYVHGVYGRADDRYLEWDEISRDPVRLDAVVADIRNVPDFSAFLVRTGAVVPEWLEAPA